MTVDKEEKETIRKALELLYQKGKDNQAITGGIGGASDFNTNNDINECVVNIETILDECQMEYDGFDWSHLVVQGIREYHNNIRESLGIKRINYYMNSKQILEIAIQKAIDGGWLDGEAALSQIKGTPDFAIDGLSNNIIFNHNFAKALWGDKPIVEYFGYTSKDIRPAYAYHLRQMVISGDAIRYLEGTL